MDPIDQVQPQSQLSRKISQEQWEQMKPLIRRMYIQEGQGAKRIISFMRSKGLDVKPSQLESQLRKWRMIRNLKPHIWRFICDITQKRRREENKDSMVILSGVPKHPNTVAYEIKRNDPPRLKRNLSRTFDEDIDMIICTPPSTYLSETDTNGWPDSLPWAEFIRTIWPILLNEFAFLPREHEATTTSRNTWPSTTLSEHLYSDPIIMNSLRDDFTSLALRTVSIAVGSKDLALSLVKANSTTKLAEKLNMLIPDIYIDRNIQRAVTLLQRDGSELCMEILKILIYLISNNLFPVASYQGDCAANSELLIKLCGFMGLNKEQPLKHLVRIARRNYTIAAVINQIFDAAIMTRSTDMACALLRSQYICPTRVVRLPDEDSIHLFFRRYPILQASIQLGNVNLMGAALNSGADCSGNDSWPSALELAAIGPNDLAIEQTRTLLDYGANIHFRRKDELSLLQLAICSGNLQLIRLLVRSGADVGVSVPTGKIRFLPSKPCFPNAFTAILDNFTCLSLAASYGPMLYDRKTRNGISPEQCIKDESVAKEMVQYFIDLNLTVRDKELFGMETMSDALRGAAYRGYKEIIRILLKNGASIDLMSKRGCTAISAAADGEQYKTCRMLLDEGAKADCVPAKRLLEENSPCLIHIAASHPSMSKLVSDLVQQNIDIEHECAVHSDVIRYRLPMAFLNTCLNYNILRKSEYLKRPLDLAIDCESWESASILLKAGATCTEGHLRAAAVRGITTIVKQLISCGTSPIKSCQSLVIALEAAIENRKEDTACELLFAGTQVQPGHLALSIKKDLPKVTEIILSKDRDLSGVDIAAVFGYSNTRWVQTLLERENLKRFVQSERHDGRTYLEMAFLSGDNHVINLALDLDATFYDSGALCAGVMMMIRLNMSDMTKLRELVRRRDDPSWANFGFFGKLGSVDGILESTALSIAACCGRLDLVELLHSTKASPYYSYHPGCQCGGGNYRGYNLEIRQRCRTVLRDRLIRWNAWHEASNNSSTTSTMVSPLFWALQSESPESVQLLVSLGYKSDGFTIKTAILKRSSVKMVRVLAKASDFVDKLEEKWWMLDEWERGTPLDVAIAEQQVDLMECLIQCGANPNGWKGRDRSPLIVAVKTGNPQLLQALVKHGADVNRRLSVGSRTALEVAVERGYITTALHLINLGANVNKHRCSSLDNLVALELAARNGRLDIVQTLLSKGVDTLGRGRVQYVRAFLLAKDHGHDAVKASLLSHRSWTEADDEIEKDLNIIGCTKWRAFFHPEEYPQNRLVTAIKAFKFSADERELVRALLMKYGHNTNQLLSILDEDCFRTPFRDTYSDSETDYSGGNDDEIPPSVQDQVDIRLEYHTPRLTKNLHFIEYDWDPDAATTQDESSRPISNQGSSTWMVSPSSTEPLEAEYGETEGFSNGNDDGILQTTQDQADTLSEFDGPELTQNSHPMEMDWNPYSETTQDEIDCPTFWEGSSAPGESPSVQERIEVEREGASEETEEEIRKRYILKDMRGEQEAPFMPTEWPL
ncbi:hypothetical protein B7494_g3715 [Chlorociboria aeruginascens]|nr:hypothetical protein B7494_g3715 [Chlorociboria aeruginascens]